MNFQIKLFAERYNLEKHKTNNYYFHLIIHLKNYDQY